MTENLLAKILLLGKEMSVLKVSWVIDQHVWKTIKNPLLDHTGLTVNKVGKDLSHSKIDL